MYEVLGQNEVSVGSVGSVEVWEDYAPRVLGHGDRVFVEQLVVREHPHIAKASVDRTLNPVAVAPESVDRS